MSSDWMKEPFRLSVSDSWTYDE